MKGCLPNTCYKAGCSLNQFGKLVFNLKAKYIFRFAYIRIRNLINLPIT